MEQSGARQFIQVMDDTKKSRRYRRKNNWGVEGGRRDRELFQSKTHFEQKSILGEE
jgi:hypothetical protein